MISRRVSRTEAVLAAVLVLQTGCIAVFGVRESEVRTNDGLKQFFTVSDSRTDESAAIRRTLKSLARADSSGDAEGAARLFTVDALWLPPERPAVAGREAIRESYERLFSEKQINVDIDAEEIVVSGDLAFARGTTRITPRGTSDAAAASDNFLMILQRDSEGLWKIHRLMWDSVAAATQP